MQNVLGNLGIHVIDFPSGKFGFVGTVPADLVYNTSDRNILHEIARSNMPAMTMEHYGVSKRVFETRQEALDFATSRGYQVR